MKKIVLAFLVIVTIVLAFIALNFLSVFKPLSSDTNAVTVEIPKGSSTTYIAITLKEKNLIKNAYAFKVLSKSRSTTANTKQVCIASHRP